MNQKRIGSLRRAHRKVVTTQELKLLKKCIVMNIKLREKGEKMHYYDDSMSGMAGYQP
jgi:hypothetical protein